MIKLFGAVATLALASFLVPPKKTTVWLIGDSTIATKEVRAYPETGWGMPFSNFFDSTIAVDNRAKNGRSTRSFREEGLWKPVLENMQPGDYVFIQFGHNDEVKTKAVYTTEQQFSDNLTQYIQEAKAKGAIPVLITPVARRKFDAAGQIVSTHKVYSQLVRDVAKKTGVQLIDLDVKSQALLQKLGPETSKMLFNYLQSGEHPNYPEGKADDTHFSELGARRMAELVLAEIKNMNLDLASHIYQPPVKK